MRFAPSGRLITSSTAALLALLPSLALAHAGMGAAGLQQGFAHPVSGMDHMLAMVAVGLLAGRIRGAAFWQIPTGFITMMVCGTVIGMAAIELPMVETGIAVSVIAFGLLLAARRNFAHLTTLLVAIFALFHGHAHGTEAAQGISDFAYVAGLLSMTALLHAAGAIAAVVLLRAHRGQGDSALRVGGSMIAMAGVGILAGAI